MTGIQINKYIYHEYLSVRGGLGKGGSEPRKRTSAERNHRGGPEGTRRIYECERMARRARSILFSLARLISSYLSMLRRVGERGVPRRAVYGGGAAPMI